MPATHDTFVALATAPRPGAVAVLQLHGPGTQRVLQQLTGINRWTPGRVRLADFAGIDRGLVTLLSCGDRQWAQLTPHGGPRVVQKLLEKLAELGAALEVNPDPKAIYPEADSPIQAEALAGVARAASPAAIDLLLAQPALWRQAMKKPAALDTNAILSRASALDRLIDPPSVVVVGRPNVGKSTLMNQMLGRSASVVADLPGTTRDWVGAVVEIGVWGLGVRDWGTGGPGNTNNNTGEQTPSTRLLKNHGSPANPSSPTPNPQPPTPMVAVRWLDTPGLRDVGDDVERRAIAIAQEVIARADVLIVMRDPELGWPKGEGLPRERDLWVLNKADQLGDMPALEGDGKGPDKPIRISAKSGEGLQALQAGVLASLGLDEIDPHTLWAFSDTLKRFVSQEADGLAGYLAGE